MPNEPLPRTESELVQMIRLVHTTVRGMRLGAVDPCEVEGRVLLKAVEKDLLVGKIWIKRKVIDEVRKLQVQRRHELEAFRERPEPRWWEEQEEVDRGEEVDVLVEQASLSAWERKLLWLRFYRGMTMEQVARELEVSKATVCETLKEVLGKLREETGS